MALPSTITPNRMASPLPASASSHMPTHCTTMSDIVSRRSDTLMAAIPPQIRATTLVAASTDTAPVAAASSPSRSPVSL